MPRASLSPSFVLLSLLSPQHFNYTPVSWGKLSCHNMMMTFTNCVYLRTWMHYALIKIYIEKTQNIIPILRIVYFSFNSINNNHNYMNYITNNLFWEQICDEFAVSGVLDKLVSWDVSVPVPVDDALQVLHTGLEQVPILLHLGKPGHAEIFSQMFRNRFAKLFARNLLITFFSEI